MSKYSIEFGPFFPHEKRPGVFKPQTGVMQTLINRFKALATLNKVSETALSKFSKPLKCSESDPMGSFFHCPHAFRKPSHLHLCK